MQVETHDRLGNPTVVTATRVLISADDGTPIAFSVEIAPNHWRHFRVGDLDFEEQLLNYGVTRTIITKLLPGKK